MVMVGKMIMRGNLNWNEIEIKTKIIIIKYNIEITIGQI